MDTEVHRKLCSFASTKNLPSCIRVFRTWPVFTTGFPAASGIKMAVLVSDDLHFGLARMSAAIHSLHGIDVEPFRDKEKAWAWLVGRR
jgi:hypothetical protein